MRPWLSGQFALLFCSLGLVLLVRRSHGGAGGGLKRIIVFYFIVFISLFPLSLFAVCVIGLKVEKTTDGDTKEAMYLARHQHVFVCVCLRV